MVVSSIAVFVVDPRARREKHDLFLDDEFFAVGKVQQVTLI
jgi:hypothetical protein